MGQGPFQQQYPTFSILRHLYLLFGKLDAAIFLGGQRLHAIECASILGDPVVLQLPQLKRGDMGKFIRIDDVLKIIDGL